MSKYDIAHPCSEDQTSMKIDPVEPVCAPMTRKIGLFIHEYLVDATHAQGRRGFSILAAQARGHGRGRR